MRKQRRQRDMRRAIAAARHEDARHAPGRAAARRATGWRENKPLAGSVNKSRGVPLSGGHKEAARGVVAITPSQEETMSTLE